MKGRNHWLSQFWRYAVVGAGSNVMLFCVYLLLTEQGTEPVLAMTVLYISGVLLTFLFNRGWSFASQSHLSKAFFRYLCSYGLGYILSLVLLVMMHHVAGWSHAWVQAFAIFSTAVLLFLLQRYWVFRAEQGEAPPTREH